MLLSRSNVMVAIVGTKETGIGGRTIPDLDTVYADNVEGVLQDTTQDLERSMPGRADVNRVTESRMLIAFDDGYTDFLQAGRYAKVTHTRHPVTNSWRPVDAADKSIYYIASVNVVAHKAPHFNVGLRRGAVG